MGLGLVARKKKKQKECMLSQRSCREARQRPPSNLVVQPRKHYNNVFDIVKQQGFHLFREVLVSCHRHDPACNSPPPLNLTQNKCRVARCDSV